METQLTQDAWDKKVIDLDGSILQSWVWGEFQSSLGFKVHRFDGQGYAIQLLELNMPFGKKYLYSARGPLGDTTSALTDIKNLASDLRLVFARLEPTHAMDLPKAAKDTQPTNNWLLSLEVSEDELLKNMKSKHRYNLNLAQKKGVTVRVGTKADILAVWQLLLETSTRNKFRLHPQNYYWQIFEYLHPTGNLEILLAEYNGQLLATEILVMFGNTATYLHGASSNQSKELMAPYALHWEAIKLSKQKGYRFYDFGGIAPEDQPRHPWVGISRFKKGFGGFELATPGAYDIVFSPLWYNVYKNARKFKSILKSK